MSTRNLSHLLGKCMRINLAGSALTKVQYSAHGDHFELVKDLMVERAVQPSRLQPAMPYLGSCFALALKIFPIGVAKAVELGINDVINEECNKQMRDALESGCEPNDKFIEVVKRIRDSHPNRPKSDCRLENVISGAVKIAGKAIIGVIGKVE